MHLMEGEVVLTESLGKTLVLTSHRVRYKAESSAYSQLQSMMLEELASCALLRISNPILLVLAVLALLVGLGFAASEGEIAGAIVGVLVGGVLFLIHSQTRQEILSLDSAGTTIRTSTKGMTQAAVEELVEKIEAAKNARYLKVGR